MPIPISLTNLSSQGTVLWRIFDPTDTVFAGGHKEGVLVPGQSASVVHDFNDSFKLEIKRGTSAIGPSLVPPQLVDGRTSLVVDVFNRLVPSTDVLQLQWSFCRRCNGLFFSNGQRTAGRCPHPAGGPHDDVMISFKYMLAHHTSIPNGQSDWRFCRKCHGLFHAGGQGSSGLCPAGGSHDRGDSWDYALFYNAPGFKDQWEWRFCLKCSALFHAGGQRTAGHCPSGNSHEWMHGTDAARDSFNYILMTAL